MEMDLPSLSESVPTVSGIILLPSSDFVHAYFDICLFNN